MCSYRCTGSPVSQPSMKHFTFHRPQAAPNLRFIFLSLCFTLTSLTGEKAMASHSSTLAWKIPWMEEPGGLQSMGSRRVGHDWTTSFSLFTFMHWRRKWQPTPVFLPGESQGWWSLVGCRLWGHKSWTQLKWLNSSSSLTGHRLWF